MDAGDGVSDGGGADDAPAVESRARGIGGRDRPATDGATPAGDWAFARAGCGSDSDEWACLVLLE